MRYTCPRSDYKKSKWLIVSLSPQNTFLTSNLNITTVRRSTPKRNLEVCKSEPSTDYSVLPQRKHVIKQKIRGIMMGRVHIREEWLSYVGLLTDEK